MRINDKLTNIILAMIAVGLLVLCIASVVNGK